MSLSVENVTEMKKSKDLFLNQHFLLSFQNKNPQAFFLWTEFLDLLTRGFYSEICADSNVKHAVTWRAP